MNWFFFTQLQISRVKKNSLKQFAAEMKVSTSHKMPQNEAHWL